MRDNESGQVAHALGGNRELSGLQLLIELDHQQTGQFTGSGIRIRSACGFTVVYGRPGDFVKKPCGSVAGEEITQNGCINLGFAPQEEINELEENSAVCVSHSMMPYSRPFLMHKGKSDRPDVIDGCDETSHSWDKFAETPRDTVFTNGILGE